MADMLRDHVVLGQYGQHTLPTLGLELITLVWGLEPVAGLLTVSFNLLTCPVKARMALFNLPARAVSWRLEVSIATSSTC